MTILKEFLENDF